MKGQAVAGAAILATLLLAIPRPYAVRCDVQLQPVTRRFVAAPFDAKLEESLVSPGDVVSQGNVLARIDGQEIRWELEGLQAEASRAAKRHDSALAAGKIAESQLARLEMERLDLRIQLLQHRVQNLQIKSPVDGIVVSGDLEKAEGAPLKSGRRCLRLPPWTG